MENMSWHCCWWLSKPINVGLISCIVLPNSFWPPTYSREIENKTLLYVLLENTYIFIFSDGTCSYVLCPRWTHEAEEAEKAAFQVFACGLHGCRLRLSTRMML